MYRLFLFLALLPTFAYGQVKAPKAVPTGQAIHFTLEDDEEGCIAQWLVLNPFDDSIPLVEIRPDGSNDFILDPPCGWSGRVRVQVIVLDADNRVKDIRVAVVGVGDGGNVDPQPTPEPTPEPETDNEYNGPNDYGVGRISFENAPSGDDAIVKLFRSAAGYLKGRPELKVLATDDRTLNNTEYNIFVWLDSNMQRKPEWADWYRKVMAQAKPAGVEIGSPINYWVGYFNEIASGVEAKK